MKIPKCPHCGKLLASIVQRFQEVNLTGAITRAGAEVAWMCPETMETKDPQWVEVKEE